MCRRELSIALAVAVIIVILLIGLLLQSLLPQPEPTIDYDASMSPTAPISGEQQETWAAVLTQRAIALTLTVTPIPAAT